MLTWSLNQGTRKYIACSVAAGQNDVSSMIHPGLSFPELDGTALQLYIGAYGEETYQRYITKFDACSRCKAGPSEESDVEHSPHHDMESVIWILFDSLTRAMPKDAKEMALTGRAISVIRNFDNHVIDAASDTRHPILRFDEENWKEVLHPSLSFLAKSLANLTLFVRTDWSFWKDELPRDFMHEALKRILLRKIDRLGSSKDHDVQLRKGERNSGGQLRKPG